uniref:Uncharacterized protein n=1 Tax=Arundo donax TaxID=35708 RepID=A0A0A9AUS2_ARUDO
MQTMLELLSLYPVMPCYLHCPTFLWKEQLLIAESIEYF